jgi:hypothetical protein
VQSNEAWAAAHFGLVMTFVDQSGAPWPLHRIVILSAAVLQAERWISISTGPARKPNRPRTSIHFPNKLLLP